MEEGKEAPKLSKLLKGKKDKIEAGKCFQITTKLMMMFHRTN